MIQKYIKKTSVFIISVVFILAALYVFTLYYNRGVEYPKSVADFSNTGNYRINPSNILLNINDGNTNIFEYTDAIPAVDINNSTPLFVWTQSDYLKVITALHQFVWKEDVDGWNVAGLMFYRTCRNTPVGFESGDVVYYKYNTEEKVYTFHEITISQNRMLASWGGGDGFISPLFGWKNVELTKLTITADEALQIAEDNGGREFRLKVKNKCDITLILKPNSDYGNHWLAYYDTENVDNSFEFFIDPYQR